MSCLISTSPDGKDTTVVSGHQTDGVAGVIHIKHHGVLLGQHIHPGQFPR